MRSQIQCSGFPIKKTLDDFRFLFPASILINAKSMSLGHHAASWKTGENVDLPRPPGVGQTILASALGLLAAQHRFSTYYIN